ncbi:hypothetical protein KTR10_01700 [Candidatus Kaiserbacteria bacterium]|nr:hypothetical protein [Candidatus Kaiserbacteria bacterium]
MKQFIASIAVCAMIATPFFASAGPVLRSGETVSVDAGQMIDGDFYGAGGTVTLSGDVLGDALVAGGSVTINAPVDSDVAIAGGTVNIHAPIADDLRVAGGEVKLGSVIQGDVVVFGGVLHVLSTAEIHGDILFFGGDLILEGNTDGSVFSMAENIRVNAFVGGDLDLRASRKVTLGDKADIQGDISYASRHEIVRSQNAVVVGDVVREEFSAPEGGHVEAVVISLLIMVFAALVALLVFRRFLSDTVNTIGDAYGKQGLIGLGVLVLTPVVAFILMASVLGMYIGIFLLIVYAAFLIASWILAGIVLGSYLMRFYTKRLEVSARTVILGIVVFELIALIPVLGPLFVLVFTLIVLGNIATRTYHSVRS